MSDLRFDLPDWHLDAACRGLDPALFFPEVGGSTLPARAICAGCPVRSHCLEWAVDSLDSSTDMGVWGGTTVKTRAALRRLWRAA